MAGVHHAPALIWRADGSLNRFLARLDPDDDDDYLLIDYDRNRPGTAKWFLTWFAPDDKEGIVLQSDVDVQGLKSYAQVWIGEDGFDAP